jgi:hypothetical protein
MISLMDYKLQVLSWQFLDIDKSQKDKKYDLGIYRTKKEAEEAVRKIKAFVKTI